MKPDDKALSGFEPKLFFKKLASREILAEDVMTDDEPDRVRYPIDQPKNRSRHYLYLMRFVYKFKEVCENLPEELGIPQILTGAHDAKYSRTYIPGIDMEAEDIYRCVVFQGWYFNKLRKKDPKPKGQDKERDRDRGTYKGLPTLPVFIVPSEQNINSASQLELQAQAMHNLYRHYSVGLSARDFMRNPSNDTQAESDAARKADEFLTANDVKLRAGYDSLSAEKRREIMDTISSSVEVLFDNVDYQDKTHFGKMDATRVGSRLEKRAEAEAAIHEDLTEQQKEKVDMDALQARFLELQASINRNSATGPEFSDAADALGLDVVRDLETNDQVTKHRFSIRYRGLDLKPWQAQAIWWVVRMVESPLRGAILADDTGLGKTIETYGAILELSVRQERKVEGWRHRVVEAGEEIGLGGESPDHDTIYGKKMPE